MPVRPTAAADHILVQRNLLDALRRGRDLVFRELALARLSGSGQLCANRPNGQERALFSSRCPV